MIQFENKEARMLMSLLEAGYVFPSLTEQEINAKAAEKV